MIRVLHLAVYTCVCVYAEWYRKIRLIFIFNCLYEHTSGTNFHRFDRLFVSRVSRLQPLPDKTVHRFVFEKTHTAPPITWATHISEKCVPVFRSFFRAAHRSQDDPLPPLEKSTDDACEILSPSFIPKLLLTSGNTLEIVKSRKHDFEICRSNYDER